MAVKSIAVLKTYFETGDKPTQEEFGHLIDSFIHKQTGLAVIGKSYDEATGDVSITFSDNSVLAFNIKGNDSEPISFIDGLQAALDSKVDKEAGKGLSSNDFTNELKTKLENLENYNPPTSEEISFINGLQQALDDKANDSEVVKTVNNTAPDASGNVEITLPQQNSYTLAPSTTPNSVDLLENGTVVSTFDLSTYLDDTNLARIVSGVYDPATKLATFTRDDNTTFTLDLSALELGVSFADEDGNVKYSGSLDKRSGYYDEVNKVYYPNIKEANIGIYNIDFNTRDINFNIWGTTSSGGGTVVSVGTGIAFEIPLNRQIYIQLEGFLSAGNSKKHSMDFSLDFWVFKNTSGYSFGNIKARGIFNEKELKNLKFYLAEYLFNGKLFIAMNEGLDPNGYINPSMFVSSLKISNLPSNYDILDLYKSVELISKFNTNSASNFNIIETIENKDIIPFGKITVLDENGVEQFTTEELQFGAGFTFNAAENEINSNSVPYVGATQNVNLGERSISINEPTGLQRKTDLDLNGVFVSANTGSFTEEFLVRANYLRFRKRNNSDNSTIATQFVFLNNNGESNATIFVPNEDGTMARIEDIPTYQEGTNITIDNTDPKNPVINASSGGGLPAGYYEEVSFTPRMFVGTGSANLAKEYTAGQTTGKAIRTGNVVHFELALRGVTNPADINAGTGNNGLIINGLPFTQAINDFAYTGTAVTSWMLTDGIESGVDTGNLRFLLNANNLLLMDGVGAQRVTDVSFNGNAFATHVIVSGTYITNVYTP